MKKTILFIILTSPYFLYAQGFQVNLQGQKQQGMGGTGTAMINDGSSLFFNPGSTAFVKDNTISVGTSPVISQTSYFDNTSSIHSKTNSPVAFPFTGYMLMGKKESKFKFGLATYTPFGSTIQWNDGWTGRFIITRLKLTTVYFQPTVSYKISEKLGVGVGFVYGLGTLNLHSDLPMTDEDGNYSTLKLGGKGSGYGFNTGVYFQPNEKLSFGINYRSALNLKINKGTATFNVPADMSANFPSGPYYTSLKMPDVLTVATAFRPSSKLTFALDVTRVGWNTYDTLRYDFENNTQAISDMTLARDYHNTLSYRLGTEYLFNTKLSGRLGIKYLTTPIKGGEVTPEVPDASHLSYSTGIGYRFNRSFSADASFTFEHIKRADANAELQLDGVYETYLFIPGISLHYRF